ncbi:hypothetical protein BSKO_12072 [Bryopsis sp. KO-2023]|nr:hypothetical protein BSKO_12072 [Bryopsis sp. KO-2023]
MDPVADIYLKVATVSESVLTTPRCCAGAKEGGTSQSRSSTLRTHEDVTTSTSHSTFSTRTTKSLLNRRSTDDWVPSRPIPRGVGVAAFVLPVVAVVLGYSISLGCRECYEGGDSQVYVPEQFAISDTFRKSPTRWTGLALTSLTSMCLCVLGWYRHFQILSLCHPLFPKLVFKSLRSGVVWAAFCFFLILAGAFPPGESGGWRSKGHLGVTVVTIVLFAAYSFIQVVQVERVLVTHQLISRSMHVLRVRLIVVALVCVAITLPLLIIQNWLHGDAARNPKLSDPNGVSPSQEHDQGKDLAEEKPSSRVPAVGTLLMIFQFGSLLHAVAAVGLTDFSSMSFNSTKLQSLLGVWKQSKKQISVVVEHPSGQSMRERYGRLSGHGGCYVDRSLAAG